MDEARLATIEMKLDVLETVLYALVVSHPNKAQLAEEMYDVAEKAVSGLLDTQTSDAQIEATKEFLNAFLELISENARLLP